MKIYLVGGAVRDELLGRTPAERDWVVVGAVPDDLLRRGFKQVGRDFPVFLHPRTGEQYALARTERRTGPGHADFVCDADPGVTLEQDLSRRDLTVNAMARAADGTLVDPYGGRRDLDARILRHVSPAFAEDPLRVFRVARFAAQLPDFSVSDDTFALMRSMAGELSALSGERVWTELSKAASARAPARFFDTVHSIGENHWFADLDLPKTIELFERREFDNASTALTALGWTTSPVPLDRFFTRLHAERLVHRAGVAVAAHGSNLAEPNTRPEILLDAFTAIEAFRQNPMTELVLRTVEACTNTSLDTRRQLIEELHGLRVDAEPGPAYGAMLRQARLSHIGKASP